MNRVAHPLEIGLSKELGHGRSRDSGRLRYKHGVVALLVTAAVVAVVLHIMVQESCLAANRTGRIALRSSINTLRRFRCPLIQSLAMKLSAKLSVSARKCIVLKWEIMLFVEQLSPREIASHLNCSVQYVYNQRSLALKSLRRIIANRSDDA